MMNHQSLCRPFEWFITLVLCSAVLTGCINWDSDFTLHPRQMKTSNWQLDFILVADTKYLWGNNPQAIIDSYGKWGFTLNCKVPKRKECQTYLYIDSLTIRSGDSTLLALGDNDLAPV